MRCGVLAVLTLTHSKNDETARQTDRQNKRRADRLYSHVGIAVTAQAKKQLEGSGCVQSTLLLGDGVRGK